MRLFMLVAAAFVTWFYALPVRACSFPGPQPFTTDPAMQGVDQQAPVLGPLSLVQINRGKGPDRRGCSTSGTSCDDIGSMAIAGAATDDVTPAAEIGYRFVVVGGSLPASFAVPSGPATAVVVENQIWLRWIDGASDDQESFDFTLSVVAIDRAGNESAPQMVRIADDTGGCTVAAWSRSPRTPGAVIALPALVTLLSRRRRR